MSKNATSRKQRRLLHSQRQPSFARDTMVVSKSCLLSLEFWTLKSSQRFPVGQLVNVGVTKASLSHTSSLIDWCYSPLRHGQRY